MVVADDTNHFTVSMDAQNGMSVMSMSSDKMTFVKAFMDNLAVAVVETVMSYWNDGGWTGSAILGNAMVIGGAIGGIVAAVILWACFSDSCNKFGSNVSWYYYSIGCWSYE